MVTVERKSVEAKEALEKRWNAVFVVDARVARSRNSDVATALAEYVLTGGKVVNPFF